MRKNNREKFIERLLSERDHFELFLNQVGYSRRMTLKGVAGKWSVKDILAHIWSYEQYLADRLSEIVNGQPYTPCKTDTALEAFHDEFGYPDYGSPLMTNHFLDERTIEKYAKASLEDVVALELQAFSQIVTALEQMPGELYEFHNLQNRVIKHTYEKYHEHMREIKHWLRVNRIKLK